MLLKLKTAPTIEPIEIEDAKTHLRVDGSDDDIYIENLIIVARQYSELICGPLITQTWEQYEDNWPSGDRLEIGKPHLLSVTSPIAYTDIDGVAGTFTSTYYTVDTVNEWKPGIVLKESYSWPTDSLFNLNPIVITFVCGYGAAASAIPMPIKHAMLLMIGHWYQNRELYNISVSGSSVVPIPWQADALLVNYRVW